MAKASIETVMVFIGMTISLIKYSDFFYQKITGSMISAKHISFKKLLMGDSERIKSSSIDSLEEVLGKYSENLSLSHEEGEKLGIEFFLPKPTRYSRKRDKKVEKAKKKKKERNSFLSPDSIKKNPDEKSKTPENEDIESFLSSLPKASLQKKPEPSMTDDLLIIEAFINGKQIGEGHFGKVKKFKVPQEIRDRHQDKYPEEVSGKLIQNFNEEVLKEINILYYFRKIRYFQKFYPELSLVFEDGVLLVTELLYEFHLAYKNPKYADSLGLNDPDMFIGLILDYVVGLGEMHKHGLVHRDIKPNNLMIRKTETGLEGVIIDFGISTFPLEETHYLGTYTYIDVDTIIQTRILKNKRTVKFSSDIFAIALTFIEMLTKTQDFTSDIYDSKEFEGLDAKNSFKLKEKFDTELNNLIVNLHKKNESPLLKSCLDTFIDGLKNERERLSIQYLAVKLMKAITVNASIKYLNNEDYPKWIKQWTQNFSHKDILFDFPRDYKDRLKAKNDEISEAATIYENKFEVFQKLSNDDLEARNLILIESRDIGTSIINDIYEFRQLLAQMIESCHTFKYFLNDKSDLRVTLEEVYDDKLKDLRDKGLLNYQNSNESSADWPTAVLQNNLVFCDEASLQEQIDSLKIKSEKHEFIEKSYQEMKFSLQALPDAEELIVQKTLI